MNSLKKFLKGNNIIVCIGLLVLVAAFLHYSDSKVLNMDGYTQPLKSSPVENVPEPNDSVMESPSLTGDLPQNCRHQTADVADLLPKMDNQFSELNPVGNKDFNDVNLLKAGWLAGVNTVGGTLRNPNLQIRSEPANPQKVVSPWQTSTIEPDPYRRSLEIGCEN